MFSLTVSGLFSIFTIPKESSPEIIVPIGVVSTTLRGASAEDTEKLITDKIEDEVANLENIDKVTSSSREGISVVTAQFLASADIDKAIQDLKDAVDRAKVSLPKEADEPNVIKINFADQPTLIISLSLDLPPSELADLADDVSDEIKKVAGISKVNISGTRPDEVQVILKKEMLARYNLRVDQVISAIATANASLPVGNITVADINYPVQFVGTIDEPSLIENLEVGLQNGSPIYLRDVAYVSNGIAPAQSFSRISVDGKPSQQAITLYVYKKTGGDITKIAEATKEKVEELKGELLRGAEVVVSFDAGKEVEKSLSELGRAGLETFLLVMLVLFLSIGWREAIVAALSIPLSFVIAFIGLDFSGNTINFMSLFSLILSIGILVDSGIVVTEAIHTRTKTYGSAEKAAVASIHEYAWPLIAGTMATVVFFVPLFFLSGILGKFLASIPYTIIFVLVASIVVALGMVPLIATLLTKKHKNRLEEFQDRTSEKAKDWYRGFLSKLFDNRKTQNWFLVLMGVGFFASLFLPTLGLVKVQFFPQDDFDFIYVQIEKPQGTPLAVTDRSVREVEELLYTHPYVTSFVTAVGESSVFTESGPSNAGKLANITVNLRKERDRTSTQIMEDLRIEATKITSAQIRVEQPSNGPPGGAPVNIKFLGNDLKEVAQAVNKAEQILKEIPGTRDIETSLRDDGTQFELEIDREKTALVGLSATQIAQTLRAAISGTIATTIKKDQKDIDVIVKLNLNNNFVHPEDTTKTTIDAIEQIPISTPNGIVLMGTLLRGSIAESRSAILHEDRKRYGAVSAQLREGANALAITETFKKRLPELGLSENITVDFGGESEDINKSFTEMILALVAGIVLTLIILLLEFNSFRFSFYLILIIPLSLIGVLGGLAISRQTLSITSMLGVIALAGVIINHAIILLDSIIHRLRDSKEHETLKEIIVEASAVRLRPIFLTTVTTVIGMIPLSMVSALWGPLAFAIMFGLSFAMILTLVLIPVLFYRWPGKEFGDRK